MTTSHLASHIQIRARKGWARLNMGELWRYRELLIFMVWRDIIIRYKQTVIGVGWALVQPVLSMVVFSLVFGGLAGIPSDGVPYPLFNFAAMVPWTFFAGALNRSAISLVNNTVLITKIYFPRLIIPSAGVLAGITDFLIALVILILMIWAYILFGQPAAFIPAFTAPLHVDPYLVHQIPFISWNWLWLPYLTLLAIMTTLGMGYLLSALMVPFRDIRFIVPFLVQMWLYISPIVYPSSMITNEWVRLLYALNPMTGVVEGFRWALLANVDMPSANILIGSVTSLIILMIGVIYFKHQESTFADII